MFYEDLFDSMLSERPRSCKQGNFLTSYSADWNSRYLFHIQRATRWPVVQQYGTHIFMKIPYVSNELCDCLNRFLTYVRCVRWAKYNPDAVPIKAFRIRQGKILFMYPVDLCRIKDWPERWVILPENVLQFNFVTCKLLNIFAEDSDVPESGRFHY